MKAVVISDIHNNYQALQEFYSLIKKNGDMSIRIYFLGDFLGYLNFDSRLIELLMQMCREYRMVMLLGNHDAAVFNRFKITDLRVKMSDSLAKTIMNNLAYEDEILKIKPYINFNNSYVKTENGKYVFSHGGISDPLNHYYYPDLCFIERYIDYFAKDTVYVSGHTHRPFIANRKSTTFINVGSIGLPRDNDPRGSYLLINKGSYELKRFFYALDKEYDYNINLSNHLKNRIYFGGKSIYSKHDILNIKDKHEIIQKEFKNYHLYNRAIYVKKAKRLWQIFKIYIVNQEKYLLRFASEEILFNKFSEVVRRIRDE